MHSIKSFTSSEANQMLNRSGRFWQKEYFDRYIRNARQFAKTISYIENNPVKANLCAKAEDWPLVVRACENNKIAGRMPANRPQGCGRSKRRSVKPSETKSAKPPRL